MKNNFKGENSHAFSTKSNTSDDSFQEENNDNRGFEEENLTIE